MPPRKENLHSATNRLRKFNAELDLLEQMIKADLISTSESCVQQLSTLRAQVQVVIDEIETSTAAQQAYLEHAHADTDHKWHALKAAIKSYRRTIHHKVDGG
jgi:DNA-binding FrmR family transcriptional regulator